MGRKRELIGSEWLYDYMNKVHLADMGDDDPIRAEIEAVWSDPKELSQWAIDRLGDDMWTRLKASERQYKRRHVKRWMKKEYGTDIRTWDDFANALGGEAARSLADYGKEMSELAVDALNDEDLKHPFTFFRRCMKSLTYECIGLEMQQDKQRQAVLNMVGSTKMLLESKGVTVTAKVIVEYAAEHMADLEIGKAMQNVELVAEFLKEIESTEKSA